MRVQKRRERVRSAEEPVLKTGKARNRFESSNLSCSVELEVIRLDEELASKASNATGVVSSSLTASV